jgi:hypothetical protein
MKRRLRSLLKPDTWRGLGLEATATLQRQTPVQELSWPLPEDIEMRILWPRSYDSPLAERWLGAIRDALRILVTAEEAHIPQVFPRILLAEIFYDGERRRIALDYADSMSLNERCAEQVDIYFKMQFRDDGYALQHVVPGGFVANGPSVLQYLPILRGLRRRRSYRYDVYGAFSERYASHIRRRAIDLLKAERRFAYEGGLEVARYSTHLLKTARARVCIDLPGNGPFCFRLVEYLAIGSCIVAAPHGARLHVPLTSGEQLIYTRPDLADLPAVAASLVQDEGRRERLANAASVYYDRYLHPTQLAAYYLQTTLNLAT